MFDDFLRIAPSARDAVRAFDSRPDYDALCRRQAAPGRRARLPGLARDHAARRRVRPTRRTPRPSTGSATRKNELVHEKIRTAASTSTRAPCATSRPCATPGSPPPSCRRQPTPRWCCRSPGSPTSSSTASTGVVAERGPARQARARHVPRRGRRPGRARAEQAAVFEDAIAGVEAGRAGGFGFVVGVDRPVRPTRCAARRGHRRQRPRRVAGEGHDPTGRPFTVEPWACASRRSTWLAGVTRVGLRPVQRPHRPARQPRRRRAARHCRAPT